MSRPGIGTLPRLIAIMGSGETSPTMRAVHRRLIDRYGAPPVPAAMLDTPFGFQMNADELTTKAVEYFRVSVQRDIAVAGFRSADAVGSLAYQNALRTLEAARYVFAGPGSPTYALRQWRASAIPERLKDKVTGGGCICFASAAALTLGLLTLPVYEIYKVGGDLSWVEGLDLLGAVGITAAVIPHYNNQEGGTHDTRYCYLGERRLRVLEDLLPEDAFILGVEEHTACVIDLDAGTFSIDGIGEVVVRKRRREQRLGPGTTAALDELGMGDARHFDAVGEHWVEPSGGESAFPFSNEVAGITDAFDNARQSRDLEGTADALLAFDALLWEWSRETFGTDEFERARQKFRSMIAELGSDAHAASSAAEERTITPFVEALVEIRERARAQMRFEEADSIRTVLEKSGIQVSDDRDVTRWSLEKKSRPQKPL
jgi:hypothetical protein